MSEVEVSLGVKKVGWRVVMVSGGGLVRGRRWREGETMEALSPVKLTIFVQKMMFATIP